jgi:hypothetical protein
MLAFALMVGQLWAQSDGDDASWNAVGALSTNVAGAPSTIAVNVTNSGSSTWQAGGPDPTSLTYAWVDAGGNVQPAAIASTPLTDDVAPGATIDALVSLVNPSNPGDYTLQIALMRDGGWLESEAQAQLLVQTGEAIAPVPVQAAAPPALHVAGNRLVNDANKPVNLFGVNRADTANMCLHGVTNVAPMDQASVQAMANWGVNIVRIPLNEDCWLGTGPPQASGDVYRNAMVNYIQLLNQQGFAVILSDSEAHLRPNGSSMLQDMPDASKTPAFWTSVAQTFKGNNSVMFDLWNEPVPGTTNDTTAAWTCLRDGGKCPGLPVTGGGPAYTVAGMQQLVNAVRGTGATNVVMIPGVRGDNALSHWLSYEPNDPLHNLAASWHSYSHLQCNTPTCWNAQVAPVAAKVPLIADEIGQTDCQHDYIDNLMNWLDAHQIGYLAWSWWVGDCAGTPSLISDYDGTPSNFGLGFRNHISNLLPPAP